MAFPALVRPDQVPAHLLFPEEYARSKTMILRDFAYFGSVIVLGLVLAALLNQAILAQAA